MEERELVEIADIIKGHEGSKLEFKRDLSSLKPIMKTLVAFANTAGGILVIGRDDNGTINGLDRRIAGGREYCKRHR